MSPRCHPSELGQTPLGCSPGSATARIWDQTPRAVLPPPSPQSLPTPWNQFVQSRIHPRSHPSSDPMGSLYPNLPWGCQPGAGGGGVVPSRAVLGHGWAPKGAPGVGGSPMLAREHPGRYLNTGITGHPPCAVSSRSALTDTEGVRVGGTDTTPPKISSQPLQLTLRPGFPGGPVRP